MRLNRLLTALILLSLALPAMAEKIPDGGTVTIAYYDEPQSLNPLDLYAGSGTLMESLMFNGLAKSNGKVDSIPDLAERWEDFADGLTWTFFLKKGVRFSDGAELTADDVVATYSLVLDPKTGERDRGGLGQILKDVRAQGKNVVQFILKTPYGLFPSYCERSILPTRAVKGTTADRESLAKHPIGTGPFMLSEWTPGKIILDANPSYFEGRPHIDRVVFKKFEDQKRAWTSLMQGSTDVVFDIDQEDFSVIKDDKRFTTYEYLDTFCFALIFNTRSEPFSSSELRKAISFAIDKNDLVSKALLGGGVATTGPFPPGSWAYNPDPSIQAFDPQKAGKLLADLGWVDTDGDWIREKNGQKLQFTVLINDNDKLQEATAKRLQWQLLQAGIRLDVKILPIAELVPNHLLNGNFQATIVNLNTMDNPDRMSSTFWDSSSIGAFNMSAYSNPEVDRLIRIGRTTSADKGKATIYQRIHKLLASDAPAVFLYFKKRYTALSGRLHGFQAGQTSQIGISFINWYISGASQKEGR